MKLFLIPILLIWSVYGQCQQPATITTSKANTEISIEFLFKGYDNLTLTIQSTYDEINYHREIPLSLENGKVTAKININEPVSIIMNYGDKKVNGYASTYNGQFLLVEPGEKINIIVPTEESRLYADVRIEGKWASPKAKLMRAINLMLEEHNKTLIYDGIFLNTAKNDMAQWGFDAMTKIGVELAKYKGIVSEEALNIIKFKNWAEFSSTLNVQAPLLDSPQYNFAQQFKKFEKLFPAVELIDKGKVWVPYSGLGGLVERASIMYVVQRNMNYQDLEEITHNKLKMISILKGYYTYPKLQECIISAYFISEFRKHGFTDELVQLAKNFISKSDKTSFSIRQLRQFMADTMQNQNPGMQAFAFDLIDENKKKVTLNDFKGKVVLLDFNYNGCGGCIQIVPEMEELENLYANKDFVVISISVDASFEKFVRAIGKYNSKNAIHLNTNSAGYDHQIVKHYQVQAYPTLVLIDKVGKLISGRAPDPRFPSAKIQLHEMIDKALN